ncbi:hypothetical protein DB30_03127 [Enhygromyxa salina]|uniref:Uncharacterized protein n=1 Tax=Enhygromyxa salina TaxID=215803 RepID=A0A0C1ZLG5_9BACT|nr:hypothetical protein [Enhygromyxa salina]KIG11598.1 hypothetical protein DB30_03127 [Enhygromyxa salina]
MAQIIVWLVIFSAVLDIPWYVDLVVLGLTAVGFSILQIVLRQRWRARMKATPTNEDT